MYDVKSTRCIRKDNRNSWLISAVFLVTFLSRLLSRKAVLLCKEQQ